MRTLKEYIKEAEEKKVAIGHFNISDTLGLKAIFETAQKLKLPVIIGVSEGERDFVGVRQVAALVKSLREEHDFPIFLNADHTHSLERIKEAVEAGFDAVLFDGAATQPLDENIRQTKEVVQYVRSKNKTILVEGELGNIGTGSEIRKALPKGAAIKPEDLTKSEDAAAFAKETGLDLLAPAVGNIHGMFANAPEPALNISRIKEIKKVAQIPLVLHGGSGNTDEDFQAAIQAGVSIIHINTELRLAWRVGLEKGLKAHPDEVAPYKISSEAIEAIKAVVEKRLKLFNG